jgi:biotin operon repressor
MKEKKPSQAERILKVLLDAKGGWISAKVFKRDMWISEANARISELRNKGWDVETGDDDEYGYALHRILPKKEPSYDPFQLFEPKT